MIDINIHIAQLGASMGHLDDGVAILLVFVQFQFVKMTFSRRFKFLLLYFSYFPYSESFDTLTKYISKNFTFPSTILNVAQEAPQVKPSKSSYKQHLTIGHVLRLRRNAHWQSYASFDSLGHLGKGWTGRSLPDLTAYVPVLA